MSEMSRVDSDLIIIRLEHHCNHIEDTPLIEIPVPDRSMGQPFRGIDDGGLFEGIDITLRELPQHCYPY